MCVCVCDTVFLPARGTLVGSWCWGCLAWQTGLEESCVGAGCQSCLVWKGRLKEKNWDWCSLGACLLPERPIAICSAALNITSQKGPGYLCT